VVVLAILRQLWGGLVSQVHHRYRSDWAVPNDNNQLEQVTLREDKNTNLAEFGDIDEAGKVLQIRTLIIELA